MKGFFKRGLIASSLLLAAGAAFAASGLWLGLPIMGGASYCVGSSTPGVPGTTAVCNVTAPAGPTAPTGSELFPADTGNSNGAASVLFKASNLGIGLRQDVTSVGTTQTIPPQTPYYFLDGAQGSALTVTMPATPVDGHIQRIVCTAATVGTLTVAANTGQTLKNNPNAACTAGVGYAWIYVASSTTWFRFQ